MISPYSVCGSVADRFGDHLLGYGYGLIRLRQHDIKNKSSAERKTNKTDQDKTETAAETRQGKKPVHQE